MEKKTKRNRYMCDAVTVTCIMLHRLSATYRWNKVELNLSTSFSKMRELFWEYIELYAHSSMCLINVRPDLLVSRSIMYAECIKQKRSQLD